MRYPALIVLTGFITSSSDAADTTGPLTAVGPTEEQGRLTVASGSAVQSSSLLPVPLPSMLPSFFLSAGPSMAEQSEGEADSATPAKPLKSPGRALVLSAAFPGAGEFYAGARKRAALFFGLEVVGWTLWSKLRSEGNDIEDEFRQMADDAENGWIVDDYLAWDTSSISNRSSKTHHLPCRSFIEDKPRRFDECPESEKQQYYELIGKYDQFIAGWSDLTDRTGNKNPEIGEIDSVENYHSDLRIAYEDRRNDSNKLLKRATNVAGIILVNHVFSAIDAARAARSTAPRTASRSEPRTRLTFVLPSQNGLHGTPMLMAYRRF